MFYISEVSFVLLAIVCATPRVLTLNAPSKTAADYRHSKLFFFFFFFFFFSEKTWLYISCDLFAKQTIHMNCQAIFSLKNES